MQAKLVVILLIVFTRDKEGKINLLQKLHVKVIQFFNWDSSNESIGCTVIEGIIIEFDSQYDTDNNDTMDGKRIHRHMATLNESINIDQRENEAFDTTMRVL